MTTIENTEEKGNLIVTTIRRRASYFLWVSWASLFLIISSLIGAALFFIYAGSISINDAQKLEALKTTQLEENIKREKNITEELDKLNYQIRLEMEGQQGDNKTGISGYGPQAQELAQQRDRYLHQLDDIRKERQKLSDPIKQIDDSDILSQQFINTIMTRALVIFLLIFLIRVLSSQYKYTIRMAAHFHSIADAIEIHSENKKNQDDLKSLIISMNTSNLTFSDSSELPLGLISEILGVLKNKNS